MGKLEEASRNELLYLAKTQHGDRYNRAAGYKGFSVQNIDMNNLLRDNTLLVVCRVGDYNTVVQLQDVLYWIEMSAEYNQGNQINTKGVTQAIMNSIDGMDIKIDCSCPDFCLEENTKIKLLNGKVLSIKEIKEKFDNNEELWVYSTDEKGDFKPGKVTNVWVSGSSSQMIKVILDNGKEIITTPNHRYMMRDGSYTQAQDLNIGDSLMPLYFKYDNGYESVKRNSQKSPTIFDSVYKIVANTVLSNEKEEAILRTGEQIIQIHHRDFNKLNNYPSNLYPMGKLEHWMYHANLGGEHIDKFIEGGRRFWQEDPRRFEALKKQKQRTREYQLNMWNNFTAEERKEYINKSRNARDNDKLSNSLKTVWANYTEEELQNRLKTTNFVVNNPMLDEEFLSSEKFKARNKVISQKLREFNKTLTSKQRSELYGWSKGKKQSKETISKKSKSLKEYYRKNPNAVNKQNIEKMVKNSILPGHTPEVNKKRSETLKKLYIDKINNLPTEERALFLFKKQLENADLSGFDVSDRITIGKIKPVLIDMFQHKLPMTEENYMIFKGKKAPKISTISSKCGSWDNICDLFGVQYNHKVISIEWLEYDEPISVYDLTVDKYHNFYADAGVMLHNCYRFAYQATLLGYKYGKPETRPNRFKQTNKDNYGSACKHALSVLSNKRWLQQITGRLMDWIEQHIDEVNKFLRRKPGEELTLPNELARQNAKLSWQNRRNKQADEEESTNEENNVPDNVDTQNSIENGTEQENIEGEENK